MHLFTPVYKWTIIHNIMYEYSKYLEEIDDDVGEEELFNAGHVKHVISASSVILGG